VKGHFYALPVLRPLLVHFGASGSVIATNYVPIEIIYRRASLFV